jgi:hypothetical protein
VTGSSRDARRQSSPSVRSRLESDGALRGRGARIVGPPGPEQCRLARVPPTISQALRHGFLRDQTLNPALFGEWRLRSSLSSDVGRPPGEGRRLRPAGRNQIPVRAQVRDAQGAVAALELNDGHVADRLEDVLARRADVLTDQDRLVAALQAAPGQAALEIANVAAGRLSCPAARYAADGSDAAWPRPAQLQPKGRGTDRRRLRLNELSAIARQATTPVFRPPLCGASRTTGVRSPVPTKAAPAQQRSRRTRAGSLGPSPHAAGGPVSDYQEALGAAARLPLVLLAHRGSGKTSTAPPLIGQDPEAGHGYEGKTGCQRRGSRGVGLKKAKRQPGPEDAGP